VPEPFADQPSIPALLEAARALARRADDAPAKRAYVDVLRHDPACLEALLELARLALRSGHRSAARTAYEQAILCHPQDPTARVNLGALLIESDEFEAARVQFEAAVALRPDLAAAHHGLARALTALGDAKGAAMHLRRSYGVGGLAPQPFCGAGPGVQILLLVSDAGGNIPTGGLLDDTVFAVTALYAERYDPGLTLPPHALVFNAIGDADLCGEALRNARAIVARTPAPVVNAPDAVRQTGRAAIARRLGRLDDLEPAIADLPGDQLLAIEPLDARGPDGRFRKYRVMLIAGAAYPLHLAISADWKVHYFSADMVECRASRAEEAAFLVDIERAIGKRAVRALSAIASDLDLDYAGVDFAVAPDGRLLLFEANAGMVIAPPGSDPMWDYRRAPTERALAAVKSLLLTKAGAGA
jgi:tetratricopeptide (TPR) repeat protein